MANSCKAVALSALAKPASSPTPVTAWISAHAFRHTFASLLIVGLKLDPVNVAAQLGHSNPNVTVGTYSHLFDKARAADSMRTALGDGFGHLLAASS